MEKIDIRSLYFSELEIILKEMGEKSFRAGQVYGWLHEKTAEDFGQMTNLPVKLRQALEERFELTVPELVEERVSRIDGTRKYLFRLADGNVIESVDAVPSWKFRVYFFSGGMSDGMLLLCFYFRRPGKEPDPIGDVGAGIPDPGADKKAGLPHCHDGIRRAL